MDQNHEYSMSRMMDDGSNHEGFFKGGNNNNTEAKIIICIIIQEVDSIIGAINKKRQNSQNIWGTICFVTGPQKCCPQVQSSICQIQQSFSFSFDIVASARKIYEAKVLKNSLQSTISQSAR